MAPTPMIASSRPTPLGPVSMTSTASTTSSTRAAPPTNVWPATWAVMLRRSPSEPSSRNPAASWARVPSPPPTASAVGSAPRPRMPRTRVIDTTNVPTLSQNTVSTLVSASSSPPMAGPMNTDRLSSVLLEALEAVSSRGVLARAGIHARCAVRNGALRTPATTASA